MVAGGDRGCAQALALVAQGKQKLDKGDRDAAANLAAAAKTMSEASGALQLRTLQTLDGLGASPSNTVVLAVPTEVFEALRAVPGFQKALERKE